MSISATPGGAVGWTSTGSARASIALPDRRECRIGERNAADVREHHHARRTRRACALELGERKRLVLPGQRREPAQSIGVRGARGRHVVVHDAGSLQADLGRSPIAVRTRERDHADVHAVLVHRLQPQVVIEHRGNRRHERRAVEMNGAQAAANFLHRVARRAVVLQQIEPRLGEGVGVDIDDGTGQFTLRSRWRQSTFAPESLIACAQRGCSAAIVAANCSGVCGG